MKIQKCVHLLYGQKLDLLTTKLGRVRSRDQGGTKEWLEEERQGRRQDA